MFGKQNEKNLLERCCGGVDIYTCVLTSAHSLTDLFCIKQSFTGCQEVHWKELKRKQRNLSRVFSAFHQLDRFLKELRNVS